MNNEKILLDEITANGGELIANDKELSDLFGYSVSTIRYWRRVLERDNRIDYVCKVIDMRKQGIYTIKENK